MKLSFHLYTLERRHGPLSPGILLRVEEENSVGYSDCHPQPSCGDLPLEEQLKHLCKEKTTPLLRQSLYAAHIDLEARKKNQNLFKELPIPESNFTAICQPSLENDLLKGYRDGFRTFKCKCRGPLARNLSTLHTVEQFNAFHPQCLWRFDFDSTLDPEETRKYFIWLKNREIEIDFFEDPLPYALDLWRELQKELGIPFAADRLAPCALGESAIPILIWKPAVDPPLETKRLRGQRVVVTSYLDHPLGQLYAAYWSARLRAELGESCMKGGLHTDHLYLKHPLTALLKWEGPHLTPPPGAGLGGGELLEAVAWLPLPPAASTQ